MKIQVRNLPPPLDHSKKKLIPLLYRNPYVISDARSVNKTFTVQWSICDKSYVCSKYVANQLKKGIKAKSRFFFSQVLLEKGYKITNN
jgi:hypothetical protein